MFIFVGLNENLLNEKLSSYFLIFLIKTKKMFVFSSDFKNNFTLTAVYRNFLFFTYFFIAETIIDLSFTTSFANFIMHPALIEFWVILLILYNTNDKYNITAYLFY